MFHSQIKEFTYEDLPIDLRLYCSKRLCTIKLLMHVIRLNLFSEPSIKSEVSEGIAHPHTISSQCFLYALDKDDFILDSWLLNFHDTVCNFDHHVR